MISEDFRSRWNWKRVDLELDLEVLALRFEADVYEEALQEFGDAPSEPRELELLVALSDLYARLDLVAEALRVDRRLVEIFPDEPKFHYNLACGHSRLGAIDDALVELRRAIELGYENLEKLRADRDFDNLKTDARFDELLDELESSH